MPHTVPELPAELLLQMKGERSPLRRVELWLDACRNIQYSDPARALPYAMQAERVAKAAGLKEREIHAYRMGGICLYAMYDYAGALKVFEKSIIRYRKIKEDKGLARAYQNRGLALRGLGKHEEALASYRHAEELYRKLDEDVARLQVLNNIGSVAGSLDRPVEALSAYADALAIAVRYSDDANRAQIIGNMADIYITLGDTEVGIEWARRSLELHRANREMMGVGLTLLNIGRVYQSKSEWTTAATYFEEALTIFKQLCNTDCLARVYFHFSQLAAARRNWADAADNAQKALELFAVTKDTDREVRCLIVLTEALSRQGKFPDAHMYLKQGRALLDITDNASLHLDVDMQAAGLAVAEKQWTRAQKYLANAATIAGAHAMVHREANVADMQAEVYEQQDDYQKALASARKSFRLQREAEEQLRARHSQTLQLRLDVERSDRERAIVQLHNEKLSLELESRTREVNIQAVSVAQKNELLASIVADIKAAENVDPQQRGAMLKSLVRRIELHRRTGEDWKNLAEQLTGVHDGFLRQLSAMCKELTPAELRIASLIKLNLSSKAMSDILSITSPAIDVYRSRIRKKLGIPSAVSLASFLQNLN